MNKAKRQGACHCGAVRFEVALKGGLKEARRCNCSLCRMRGAVALSADRADFALLEGADRLTLYQFGTKTAEHYFCSVCGIYTHHRRRSHPNEYGVNAACLEGLSPFDFATVRVTDGVHHVKDFPESPGERVVGVLRYEPSER